jgi:hypothetical protein
MKIGALAVAAVSALSFSPNFLYNLIHPQLRYRQICNNFVHFFF